MPRNFDEMRKQRDLGFVVGDQAFTLHMMPLDMIGVWTEREDKVDLTDQAQFQQMCIDRVADAVADGNGSEERWRELCKSKQSPSYGELLELSKWAWEAQSELPTMALEASAQQRGSSGAKSKVG